MNLWKRIKTLWYLSGLDLSVPEIKVRLPRLFSQKAKILEPVNLDELLK